MSSLFSLDIAGDPDFVLHSVFHSLPSRPLPSDEDVFRESRGFATAFARVFLAPYQRKVLDAVVDPSFTELEKVPSLIGMSSRNVTKVFNEIRQQFFPVFESLVQEEGHDFLAQDLLLMRFFPELLRDEKERPVQFEKLRMAGIIFTDDGRIDLTQSGSNIFFTTIFKTSDGGFTSGFDIAESRSACTVQDLFRGRKIHDDLCIPGSEAYIFHTKRNKGSLNSDDALTALRSPVNLRMLRERGHLRVGSDGQWHLFFSRSDFLQKWCHFNGDYKTGKPFMSLCGLDYSQSSQINLFRQVFSPSELVLIPSSPETNSGVSLEKLTLEGMLFELRSRKNISSWRSAGVFVHDGKCTIYTKTTLLDSEIRFNVCGFSNLAENVLDKLGLCKNRDGFRALCEMVFPDCVVLDRRRRNGTIILDETDYDVVVSELRSPDNLEKLASVPRKNEDGKFIIGLSMRHFPESAGAISFYILGQYFGMHTLLRCLKLPVNSIGIRMVYRNVFGEDAIFEPDCFHPEISNNDISLSSSLRSDTVVPGE